MAHCSALLAWRTRNRSSRSCIATSASVKLGTRMVSLTHDTSNADATGGARRLGDFAGPGPPTAAVLSQERDKLRFRSAKLLHATASYSASIGHDDALPPCCSAAPLRGGDRDMASLSAKENVGGGALPGFPLVSLTRGGLS